MPDLNTQLREYFDATAPPLEVEEVVGDEVLVPGWAPGGNENDVVEPTPTTVAPAPETMSDLVEVVEAGVAALYSGDEERAVQLFEL